jgi:hypothetical protein
MHPLSLVHNLNTEIILVRLTAVSGGGLQQQQQWG